MSISRFGPPRAAGYTDLDRSLPPSPATPRHPLASPTWTNASTPPASPLRTPNDPLLRHQDLTGSASPQPAPRTGSSPHRSHARSSSVSRRTGRDELAGPYLRSSPFATSRDSLASHSSGVSAAHMGAGRGELGASFGEGTSHSISFAPDLSEEDRRPERPYSAKEALLDERMHTFQAGDSLSTGDRTSFRISGIGFLNLAAIALIVVTLVTLFAGYPIINWATLRGAHHQLNAYNLGDFRGNGSGQVPEIPGFSGLIDATTPRSAMTRIGSDGKKCLLQFSDEVGCSQVLSLRGDGSTDGAAGAAFSRSSTRTAGRSIPATIHIGRPSTFTMYVIANALRLLLADIVSAEQWATNDLEWYDPEALVTRDGNLVGRPAIRCRPRNSIS